MSHASRTLARTEIRDKPHQSGMAPQDPADPGRFPNQSHCLIVLSLLIMPGNGRMCRPCDATQVDGACRFYAEQWCFRRLLAPRACPSRIKQWWTLRPSENAPPLNEDLPAFEGREGQSRCQWSGVRGRTPRVRLRRQGGKQDANLRRSRATLGWGWCFECYACTA